VVIGRNCRNHNYPTGGSQVCHSRAAGDVFEFAQGRRGTSLRIANMMVAEMLQTSESSGHMTGNEPHGNPIAPLGMESDTVRYINILALVYSKDSLASAPRPSASIDCTRRSHNGDYNMMGARRLRMQLDEGSIERLQELFGCHL
jgi:hypothetical protein